MAKAKEIMSRVRARLRDEEAEARRGGAALATSYVIGSMETSGAMASVPQLFGLPRTVTLAVLAKAGGTFARGPVRDYLQGVGDSAAIIATYNFSKGGTVSGIDEVSGRRRNRRHRMAEAANVERQLRAQLQAERAHSLDELDELESEAAHS